MYGLNIERVSNGFVVSGNGTNEALPEIVVFQELGTEDNKEHAVQLLDYIIDYFDLRGSRYDGQRIFVSIEAGDKYEDGSAREGNGEENRNNGSGIN